MIFSRRRKREREVAQAEADAALKVSVDDLHTTVMEGPEVRAVAQRHRTIQRRNHFAETIRHAYRGEPA